MSRRLLNPDTDADIKVRELLDDRTVSGFAMIAGAGSGKTTSLVKALQHVIETRGIDFRANRQQVACVTYTEVARQEIEDDVAGNPIVHVSTIHSFLWTLIAPFQHDIRRWVREHGRVRLAELEEEYAGLGTRVGEKTRRNLERSIARLREGLPKVDGIQKFRYGVARNYGEGIVGHDDILKMVPELILQKPLFTQLVSRRFPLVFVDESQDTFSSVVECLRHVAVVEKKHFCLGFFGDPMQMIYLQGAGEIVREDDWKEVEKPENFRSPLRVLDFINAIRADGDTLTQVSGLAVEKQQPGEVTYFVFPADDRRVERLSRARVWLKQNSKIGAWHPRNGIDPTKILVIAHRMAALRLGFKNLYETFHGTRLSDDFDEGRAWPLTPFLSTLLPLVAAARDDRAGLLPLLRKSSPLLRPEDLDERSALEALKTIAGGLDELQSVIDRRGAGSIGRALTVARDGGLIELDERLTPFLTNGDTAGQADDTDELDQAIATYLGGDVAELDGYSHYISQESAYSTQQGVKGAEFPDVMVVLDDKEGRHHQFSYERLFGLRDPSKSELDRIEAGEETIVDRTRRLLYVCASRATEALALVFYADDPVAAMNALRASRLPGTEEILTADIVDTMAVV